MGFAVKGRVVGVIFMAGVLGVLSGCATYGKSVSAVNQAIASQTPEQALVTLKEDDFADRDIVLYHLERGTLLRLASRFDESNREFDTAKQMMERLYTTSVTKAVGSVIVNDAVTDYGGETFEKIQLLINQALNYLALGQPDNAAVMARQLDEQLNILQDETEDEDAPRTYRCDPYANYLSGIIFEALDEWSSARVVYERAYQCYTNDGLFDNGAPQHLKQALLRTLEYEGLDDQLDKYREEFAVDFSTVAATRSQGELIVVVDEGFIVRKHEKSITHMITTGKGNSQIVKIALPYYPKQNHHFLGGVKVNTLSRGVEADKVQDMDGVARAALDDAMFGIKARAIARAIVKYNASENAEEKGGIFGKLLVQVAAIASETADTRSWRSLPHTNWVARTFLPVGTHSVEVVLKGQNGGNLIKKRFDNVSIKAGGKTFLSYRWATAPSDVASR